MVREFSKLCVFRILRILQSSFFYPPCYPTPLLTHLQLPLHPSPHVLTNPPNTPSLLTRRLLPHLHLFIEHKDIPKLLASLSPQRLVVDNQYGKELCPLAGAGILAPLVMAARPFVPEVAWAVGLRGGAVHLVERGAGDGDGDGSGAAVFVGGCAAAGWDVDEEDEDGFAGEVGGVVACEDLEIFARFPGRFECLEQQRGEKIVFKKWMLDLVSCTYPSICQTPSILTTLGETNVEAMVGIFSLDYSSANETEHTTMKLSTSSSIYISNIYRHSAMLSHIFSIPYIASCRYRRCPMSVTEYPKTQIPDPPYAYRTAYVDRHLLKCFVSLCNVAAAKSAFVSWFPLHGTELRGQRKVVVSSK